MASTPPFKYRSLSKFGTLQHRARRKTGPTQHSRAAKHPLEQRRSIVQNQTYDARLRRRGSTRCRHRRRGPCRVASLSSPHIRPRRSIFSYGCPRMRFPLRNCNFVSRRNNVETTPCLIGVTGHGFVSLAFSIPGLALKHLSFGSSVTPDFAKGRPQGGPFSGPVRSSQQYRPFECGALHEMPPRSGSGSKSRSRHSPRRFGASSAPQPVAAFCNFLSGIALVTALAG